MKVAIHQPHYMPWLGYLYKMKHADLFVYLDRVLIGGKESWLTVPVLTKGKSGQPINTSRVSWDGNWNMKHYHTLLYNYLGNMKDKKEAMLEFFLRKDERLIDWCVNSTDLLCRAFGVNVKRVFASELEVEGTQTERLVNICKKVGADTYLSGPSGRDYMDEKLFDGINVEYIGWKNKTRALEGN